ncbi:hypothetical protein F4780DRAFT_779392 [Xylariomycetidae sp. FL0641]|nr:hypothetical protein F4780DRAFT_779392 [Xylariomycetidae sp. FL0641]
MATSHPVLVKDNGTTWGESPPPALNNDSKPHKLQGPTLSEDTVPDVKTTKQMAKTPNPARPGSGEDVPAFGPGRRAGASSNPGSGLRMPRVEVPGAKAREPKADSSPPAPSSTGPVAGKGAPADDPKLIYPTLNKDGSACANKKTAWKQ